MKGTTVEESTRPPGEEHSYGQIETYDSHEIDLQVYQYEVAPIEDKAAGEHGNPSLAANKEILGWKIVGPDPDGHPKLRLIARRLDHPKAVAERRLKAKKDAKVEPVQGKPSLQDLLRGAVASQGKTINLAEALAQHPSEAEIERDNRRAEELRDNPHVQKMINRGVDLDDMDD